MSDLTQPAVFVRDVGDGLNRYPGEINGLATLDSGGTLTPSQVPASIANGLTFQATWNASTNTPTLPPVSTPNPGDYWIVTTAGATALPGAAGPWTVGQCAVFNGTDWDVLQMYPLALGLPVAGASPTWVLYVDGSGNLATAATGATSGVQGYSAALAAIAGNGTPTAWGLARMLDANQAANQSALGLGALAYLATVGTSQIDDAAVTLAKMANLDTDRLIGRDTTGTGVPESLTVGGGLEFTGSGGIQRSALSGDVAASAGSGTTTIGANKVTDAMLRQSAGLSVVGNATNSTGNVADITAASDGQVLRRSGTSIGFGTIPVSSVTGAVVAEAQAVSGDTVLSSQVTAINVSASCTITLPTVASWTIGIPTQINVNGTSALTVKLSANADDKIEAAANVYLYARRGIYILMPTAANRWEVYAVCGELIIPIMGTDLSTASGGSPWTFTDSVSGASIVFTDRSSASSTMTASSGLLGAPATSTAYFSGASATGAVATTPLSGITDAWGRPLSRADRFYLAVQTVRVASAGATTSPIVALGGDVLSEGPRFGVINDLTATLSFKARLNSTSPTVDLTTASTNSSAWFGGLWAGTSDQTLSRGFLTTSAPAGMMGVTWIPQAYEDTSQGRLTPPANPTGYTLVATDQLVYAVSGGTAGTTFRATAIAVSLYRGYPS